MVLRKFKGLCCFGNQKHDTVKTSPSTNTAEDIDTGATSISAYSFPNPADPSRKTRNQGGRHMITNGASSENDSLLAEPDARHSLAELSARNSALTFTEGVRCGWLTSDFLAWTREHLVSQGRLLLPFGTTLPSVREPGFGTIRLSDHASVLSSAGRIAELCEMPALLAFARDRVIEQLRAVVATGQSRFVQAAIYGERITRARGVAGRSHWRANLVESTALSDQVLALFAVDALENPSDYEQDFAVCDACGTVSFSQNLICARGCPAHPYGTIDTNCGRHSATRSGIIAKKI